MELATKEFINNLDSIIKGTYDNELIENDAVTQLLKGLSRDKILSNRDIMSLEVTGEAVISGILNAYIKYFFIKRNHSEQEEKLLFQNLSL